MFNCPVMLGKHNFFYYIHYFWFSQPFCFLCSEEPELCGEGYDKNASFMAEHSIVPYSMHVDQSRVSCHLLEEVDSLMGDEDCSNLCV